MDAGRGAHEQAQRHEARVAAMQAEQAALQAQAADLEARIATARQQQQNWAAGAEGERRVAAVLDGLGPEWRVLHDVHWPGRPKANLDHVAVGPSGIWVVDAKNWSAPVALRDGVLRCGGWRKVQETEAVANAAAAVAALLQPFHRLLVRPVLCLAGTGADLPAAHTSSGTAVVGVTCVGETLTRAPQCLQPGEVTAIAAYLQQQLGGRTSPALATTAHLPTQPSAVHEPPHRSRARRTWPQQDLSGSAPSVLPRTPTAMRTTRTHTRSRRSSKPSSLGGFLVVIAKTALFLLAAYVFLALMPLWGPWLQELFSSVFVQPTLDRLAEQSGQVPSTAP